MEDLISTTYNRSQVLNDKLRALEENAARILKEEISSGQTIRDSEVSVLLFSVW